MDYLLRDSHHCFVKYGAFDLDKIVDSTVAIRSAGVEQLGFKEDSVWALEQMLLARHHMHRQVYGHPTRMGTDAMLIRSMKDAINGGLIPENDFNWEHWKGKPEEFQEAYLRWDDGRLLDRLIEIREIPGDLARKLVHRDLLKEAFRMELQSLVKRFEIPEPFIGQVLDDTLFTRERITSIEESVSRRIGQEPRLVILTLESVKNPTYRPPAYRMEQEWLPKDIMLRDEDGKNVSFVNVSEVFGGSREVERNYLTVYCPLPSEAISREKVKATVTTTLVDGLRSFYEELN